MAALAGDGDEQHREAAALGDSRRSRATWVAMARTNCRDGAGAGRFWRGRSLGGPAAAGGA